MRGVYVTNIERFAMVDSDGLIHTDMYVPVMFRLNPTNDEVDDLKDEIDEDGNGEIEFNEFLAIMNSTKLRQMQAVDNREGRLRRAFSKIEGPDGRIRREDLVKLLTVSTTVYTIQSNICLLSRRFRP